MATDLHLSLDSTASAAESLLDTGSRFLQDAATTTADVGRDVFHHVSQTVNWAVKNPTKMLKIFENAVVETARQVLPLPVVMAAEALYQGVNTLLNPVATPKVPEPVTVPFKQDFVSSQADPTPTRLPVHKIVEQPGTISATPVATTVSFTTSRVDFHSPKPVVMSVASASPTPENHTMVASAVVFGAQSLLRSVCASSAHVSARMQREYLRASFSLAMTASVELVAIATAAMNVAVPQTADLPVAMLTIGVEFFVRVEISDKSEIVDTDREIVNADGHVGPPLHQNVSPVGVDPRVCLFLPRVEHFTEESFEPAHCTKPQTVEQSIGVKTNFSPNLILDFILGSSANLQTSALTKNGADDTTKAPQDFSRFINAAAVLMPRQNGDPSAVEQSSEQGFVAAVLFASHDRVTDSGTTNSDTNHRDNPTAARSTPLREFI